MNILVILAILAIGVSSGVYCNSVYKQNVHIVKEDNAETVQKEQTIIEREGDTDFYAKHHHTQSVFEAMTNPSVPKNDPFNWPFTGLPYMKYTSDRKYHRKSEDDNTNDGGALAEQEMHRVLVDFMGKD